MKAHHALSICLKSLLWLATLAAILVFVLALLLRHGITQEMAEHLVGPLANENFLIRFERLQFNFPDGLRLTNLQLIRKRRAEKPLITVGELSAEVSLLPGLAWSQRVRALKMRRVYFPVLPPVSRETDTVVPDFDIPTTDEIPLVIEHANILGIRSRLLTGRLSASGRMLELHDAYTRWPDSSLDIGVRGTVVADFDADTVHILLDGKAYPSHIIPLMNPDGIDAPIVIDWMRKCTDLRDPINARADISLQISNLDYSVLLDLSANDCSWNGIPLLHLRGRLDASQRGDFVRVKLHDALAVSKNGEMRGEFDYDGERDSLRFSTTSQIDLPDALKIVEFFNQNELSVIRCDVSPKVEISGIISTASPTNNHPCVTNHVTGNFHLDKGAIMDFNVIGAHGSITLDDTLCKVSDVRAKGEHGGTVTADFSFDCTDYSQGKITFDGMAHLAQVDLRDLSRMMSITNERMGKLTGTIHASSSLGADALRELQGDGSLKFTEGVIAQIPLFSGFTPYLAEHIPGVSPLSDLSEGMINFTIKDGVLSTKDAMAEGAMFSLSGEGSYNIPEDQFDLKIRSDFFPKKSVLGFLTHLITYPFTRLLAEFKITGKFDDPQVSYYDLIEKTFGSSK